MGLPSLDGALPKGTYLYLSEEGYLLDASLEKKEISEVNRNVYAEVENEGQRERQKQEDRIDFMERSMQPGDIFLVRGNAVEKTIARNLITDDSGFHFTHAIVYMGNGEILDLNVED